MTAITDQNFDEEVMKCELPVFACFITRSCQSCYPTCRFADQLVVKYEGRVKFVRVDIEKNPEVAARYQVVAVPTILLFHGSKLLRKALGFKERASLRQMLSSFVGEEGLPKQNQEWIQRTNVAVSRPMNVD